MEPGRQAESKKFRMHDLRRSAKKSRSPSYVLDLIDLLMEGPGHLICCFQGCSRLPIIGERFVVATGLGLGAP